MLATVTYPRNYIAACRARVESQMATFRQLVAAIKLTEATDPRFEREFESFQTAFFNNMIIVLDGYFAYRASDVDEQHGDPLNEVRALAHSMIYNNETVMADDAMTMSSATSVLKYEAGDTICLTAHDFSLIADAFFAEIERKSATP